MSTSYVALINIPGYLPMDDEPPTFESSAEAWGYLAEERQRSDDAWVPDDPSDPDGPASLDECSLTLERYERDSHGVGTVYGPTPGYDGDHDLGLAYSVSFSDDQDW